MRSKLLYIKRTFLSTVFGNHRPALNYNNKLSSHSAWASHVSFSAYHQIAHQYMLPHDFELTPYSLRSDRSNRYATKVLFNWRRWLDLFVYFLFEHDKGLLRRLVNRFRCLFVVEECVVVPFLFEILIPIYIHCVTIIYI